jgi:hypothetical protein
MSTVLDSTETWSGLVDVNGVGLHRDLVRHGSCKRYLTSYTPGQARFVETVLDFTDTWSGMRPVNGA